MVLLISCTYVACVTISVKNTMQQSQPVNYPQSDAINASQATQLQGSDFDTLTPTVSNLASTSRNQGRMPDYSHAISDVTALTVFQLLLSILKDKKVCNITSMGFICLRTCSLAQNLDLLQWQQLWHTSKMQEP